MAIFDQNDAFQADENDLLNIVGGQQPAAPNNADILTGLYQDVFKRAPDQGGFDFWLGAMNKEGYTPEMVRSEFMKSPEYLKTQPSAPAPAIAPTQQPKYDPNKPNELLKALLSGDPEAATRLGFSQQQAFNFGEASTGVDPGQQFGGFTIRSAGGPGSGYQASKEDKTPEGNPLQTTLTYDEAGNITGSEVRYFTGGDSGVVYRFNPDGTPAADPKGFDYSEEWKGPVGTTLSMLAPALGPWGMLANAAFQASQGNYLGAIASGAGGLGGLAGAATMVDPISGGLATNTGVLAGIPAATFQNIATGATVANAIKDGNWGQVLGTIANSNLGKELMNSPIGDTGFTLNDATKGASALMAVQNGQYGQAITSLGQLAESKDTVVAGQALTLLQAVQSGNPAAIASAAQQFGASMSTPDRVNRLPSQVQRGDAPDVTIGDISTTGQVGDSTLKALESLGIERVPDEIDLATARATGAPDVNIPIPGVKIQAQPSDAITAATEAAKTTAPVVDIPIPSVTVDYGGLPIDYSAVSPESGSTTVEDLRQIVSEATGPTAPRADQTVEVEGKKFNDFDRYLDYLSQYYPGGESRINAAGVVDAPPSFEDWQAMGGQTRPAEAFQIGSDVLKNVVSGAASLAQAPLTLAELATGKKFAVSADLASYINSVNQSLSPELKADRALMEKMLGADPSFWETAKAYAIHPQQLIALVSQTATSALAGGGAGLAVRLMGRGIAAGEAAAMLTNAGVHGAQTAYSAMEQAREMGLSDADALKIGRSSAGLSSLVSLVAQKVVPGAMSLESKIAGTGAASMIGREAGETALDAGKAALKNAMVRYGGEAISEKAEEGSGKIISNMALGRPWNEGLERTLAEAVIASGGLMGAVDAMSAVPSVGRALTEASQNPDAAGFVNIIDQARGPVSTPAPAPTPAAAPTSETVLSGTTESGEPATLTGPDLGAPQSATPTGPAVSPGTVVATDKDGDTLTASDVGGATVQATTPATGGLDPSTVIAIGADGAPLTVGDVIGKPAAVTQTAPTQAPTPPAPTPAPASTPVLSASDVRGIVDAAVSKIPAGITADQVSSIVNQAVASNPSLTKTDVQNTVNQALSKLPPSASPQDVQGAISSAVVNLPTRADVQSIVNTAVSKIPAGITADQVGSIVNSAIAANPGLSKTDVQSIVNTSLAGLPKSATPADVNAAITKATQSLATNSQLASEINRAIAAGQSGDAALQTAIDRVAGNLGTTKTDLLSQIGKTETQLKSDFSTQLGGIKTQVANVEAKLTEAINQAVASGKTGDAALQSAINQVSSSLGTTKSDLLSQIGKTEQSLSSQFQGQLSGLESKLNAAISQAVSSGKTGDAALQAAIDQVSKNLGSTKSDILGQIGKTEAQLKSDFSAQLGGVQQQIGQLSAQTQSQLAAQSAQTQAQFNQLTAAQKSQADALVKQGQSLNSAINQVQSGLTGQISALSQQTQQQLAQQSTQTQNQFNQLSAAQKSQADALVKQGQSLTAAINQVQSGLGAQIGQLSAQTQQQLAAQSAQTQAQFNQLTASQQAQADALVKQGQSLTGAINQVQSGLAGQITALSQQTQQQLAQQSQQTQAQFGQLSAAQQAQADALVKQGQSLTSAINQVQSGLASQIGQLSQQTQQQLAQQSQQTQSQFNQLTAAQQKQADSLVQQGVNLSQAIQTAQSLAQQSISNLDAKTQAQYNSLTQAQKDQANQLAQQGQTLNNAINQVSTTLQQQVGNLDTKTQEQYNNLTQAQRDQANALVQQGKTLTNAINDVATDIQTKISVLSDEFKGQYNILSDAQKEEVEARVKQGEQLELAIGDAFKTTQAEIARLTDLQRQEYAKLAEAQKAETVARQQQAAQIQRTMQRGQLMSSLQSAAQADDAAARQPVSRPDVVKDAYEVAFGPDAPTMMAFTKAGRQKQLADLAAKQSGVENAEEDVYDRWVSMADENPVTVDELMKIVRG